MVRLRESGRRWCAASAAILFFSAELAAEPSRAPGGAAPSASAAPAAPAAAAPPAAASAPASTPASPRTEAAPAERVEYALDGDTVIAVTDSGRTPLAMPPARAVRRHGSHLYVARGNAGVSIYDVTAPLAPKLLRVVATAGAASDFHLVEGQVWAVVESRNAIPLDETSGLPAVSSAEVSSAPAAKTQPKRPSEPAASYRVSAVAPGTVEIECGADCGARVGDRFAIFRAQRLGEGGFEGEEQVDLAVVVAVKPDRALAELGRSTVVSSSDSARKSKGNEETRFNFPPRVPGVGEASVVLRPLINVGKPLGAGLLANLEATYWGGSYFASVRVDPLGFGVTSEGSIVSTAALVSGGYDGQAFSVGLGLGVTWSNGDLDQFLDDSSEGAYLDDDGSVTVTEDQDTHAAFTLAQVARLGARDGLHFWIQNLLLLYEDEYDGEDGFIYGGTSAELVIPTGRRANFFVEGGGGLMGYWFVGAGVSTWIYGNGSPGSWRLSVSAGAAGLSGSREVTETYSDGIGEPVVTTYDETVDVVGPMVSLGIARRFSF
jgi:hypothetical protein